MRLALGFKSGSGLRVAWLQLQALTGRHSGCIGRSTGEGGTIVRNRLRCHIKLGGENVGEVEQCCIV